MTQKTLPFYIAIAAHGDAVRLRKTLNSLSNCILPASYRALLLVENGTPAGIKTVAEGAPAALKVRYFYNSLPSKSAALNLALTQVPEDEAFVFFTDDDVQFIPDLLENYAKAAEKWGPGHYFGGPVFARWGEPPPTWLLSSLPGSAKGWQPQLGTMLYAFIGFNWGAFISDVRAIGPFDIRFGPGSRHGATGQETDMQARMFRGGKTPIYLEDAPVVHEVPHGRCNFFWAIHRNYRNGVSAGLTDVPFRPRLPLDGKTSASRTAKIFRFFAQAQSLQEVACRLTCELAVRSGIVKGKLIKKLAAK